MYKYSIFNMHKFSRNFLSHFAAFSIFRQIMLSAGSSCAHLGTLQSSAAYTMRRGVRPGAAPRFWRRKVISMHDSCLCKRLLVLGASLVLGILVYVLLAVGVFSITPGPLPVIVPIAVATLLLAALIPSILLCRCAPALAESWSCWGDLVLSGAAGTILSAVLAAPLSAQTVGFHIALALTAAFLTLLLGALAGFLRRYALTWCRCGACTPCGCSSQVHC